MKLTIHLHNFAEENLLDIGQSFKFCKDDDDGRHIVTTIKFDEPDDEILLESLSPDELVEFFGIDSENLIYVEVN
jgi:hypothetical protein